MQFAAFELSLLEPVHIGAGRTGMVSRTRGFVPGHVVAYALAAVLGRYLGGKPADFDKAVQAVRLYSCCGPLFLRSAMGELLRPRRDEERIATDYLTSTVRIAIQGWRRSAAEGALYEVETIAPKTVGVGARHATTLVGGIWYEPGALKLPVEDLLASARLGGDRNSGLGRTRLIAWQPGENNYAGFGVVSSSGGLFMKQGDILPGPAISGVAGAPMQPWVGRLHDPARGAGRRFSAAVLVRMDGTVEQDGVFDLVSEENGFGCWEASPVA